ncbi:MAG: SH3 domain-containing protein [Methyloceanibacter sp.]
MLGLLPSVWLLAAALYAVSLLSLIQPFSGNDDWPAPPPANETVVAKQPLSLALRPDPEGTAPTEQAAAAPAIEPKTELRNEWVQIAGYTTVVRSRPSSAAPALFAYSVGRPFRVIAREAGFVRVQDLGSGQLGWVKETSLTPFVGGYRQREHQVAEPQVAVAEPQATVAKPLVIAAKPKIYAVAAKKVQQPRNEAVPARAKKETVAAIDAGDRGLSRKKRDRIQRVALGGRNTGLAAMVDRAFRGF